MSNLVRKDHCCVQGLCLELTLYPVAIFRLSCEATRASLQLARCASSSQMVTSTFFLSFFHYFISLMICYFIRVLWLRKELRRMCDSVRKRPGYGHPDTQIESSGFFIASEQLLNKLLWVSLETHHHWYHFLCILARALDYKSQIFSLH